MARFYLSEGIHIVPPHCQAPNANAYVERWVRTVREECLDKVLIINQPHLRRTMREYTQYDNCARPHQRINRQIPIPKLIP
ncbi:MAG: transposase [Chloroflexi bacterium]|nr:transposase [Chloroflexota bacterium]